MLCRIYMGILFPHSLLATSELLNLDAKLMHCSLFWSFFAASQNFARTMRRSFMVLRRRYPRPMRRHMELGTLSPKP